MRYITIALSKGRLAELSIDFLEGAGIDCTELKGNSRKLIFTDEKNRIRFFLAKAMDVPVYVEYGAADIGIVGKDILLEGKIFMKCWTWGLGKWDVRCWA